MLLCLADGLLMRLFLSHLLCVFFARARTHTPMHTRTHTRSTQQNRVRLVISLVDPSNFHAILFITIISCSQSHASIDGFILYMPSFLRLFSYMHRMMQIYIRIYSRRSIKDYMKYSYMRLSWVTQDHIFFSIISSTFNMPDDTKNCHNGHILWTVRCLVIVWVGPSNTLWSFIWWVLYEMLFHY